MSSVFLHNCNACLRNLVLELSSSFISSSRTSFFVGGSHVFGNPRRHNCPPHLSCSTPPASLPQPKSDGKNTHSWESQNTAHGYHRGESHEGAGKHEVSSPIPSTLLLGAIHIHHRNATHHPDRHSIGGVKAISPLCQ